METRSGLIIVLFAVALLLSCPAYARNAQIVSDDEYTKAYFNLYKNYITADDPNQSKDQLLDVVDYYLTAGDVSSDLSAVGSRSHRMIGSILAENGVEFDCGDCDSTLIGANCCIYRVGQVPVVYECVGSEVLGVSSHSWKQLWQCSNGCCKDRCCINPDQSTTTLSASTSSSKATTTTLAGGDNCIDDGNCYTTYGPCYVCPTLGGNCSKKVICKNAQDCKNRYDPAVNWKCDDAGCCIPPAATTTSIVSTTSTVLTTTSTVPSGSEICKDCCAPGEYTCDVSCQNGRSTMSGFPAIASCEYDGSTLTIVRGINRQTHSCLNGKCAGGVTSSTAASSSTTLSGGSCLPDNTPVGECSSTISGLRCIYDLDYPVPYFDYDPSCDSSSSTTTLSSVTSTTIADCDLDTVCEAGEDPDTCMDCFTAGAKCRMVKCGDGICQTQILNGYGESEENPGDYCCCEKDCPGVKCKTPLSCNHNGVCDLGENPSNCPADCKAPPLNVKCSEACKGAKYYDCTQVDEPLCMYREEPSGDLDCRKITARQDSICCCGNCGDGICQSHTDEDDSNCPTDCCPDGSSKSANPQCKPTPATTTTLSMNCVDGQCRTDKLSFYEVCQKGYWVSKTKLVYCDSPCRTADVCG